MDLGQLQIAYDAAQDRLLIRVATTGGQEMRAWLTRRLVRGLWPIWQRAVAHARGFALPVTASTVARQAMVSMEREQAVAGSDFSTPFGQPAQQDAAMHASAKHPQVPASPYSPHYRAGSDSFPLGETPLLVTEVSLTPLQDGSLQTHWKDGARTLGILMNAQLMHAATKLIVDAVQTAQWNIDVALQEPATVSTQRH
jgi:hypothetical protein